MPEDLKSLDSQYLDSAQNALDFNAANWAGYNFIAKHILGTDVATKNYQEIYNSMMQNAFNSAEAAKDRQWQEYMSNTAYQRAAKDLEGLGFSPLALINGGSSATTPSGAVAHSGEKAHTGNSSAGDAFTSLIRILGTIAVSSALKSDRNVTNVNIGAGKGFASENERAKFYDSIAHDRKLNEEIRIAKTPWIKG